MDLQLLFRARLNRFDHLNHEILEIIEGNIIIRYYTSSVTCGGLCIRFSFPSSVMQINCAPLTDFTFITELVTVTGNALDPICP